MSEDESVYTFDAQISVSELPGLKFESKEHAAWHLLEFLAHTGIIVNLYEEGTLNKKENANE